MGAVAGNGLPAGHPERDVATENVPQPDLEALEQAMAEVFVEVRDAAGEYVMPDGTTVTVRNEDTVQSVYCFDVGPYGPDYVLSGFAQQYNQSWRVESDLGRPAYLWLARATGAYEPGFAAGLSVDDETVPDNCPADADFDPNSEQGILGYTVPEPESAFVFWQVVRDQVVDILAAGPIETRNLYAAVTAHEVGHQFELTDAGASQEPHLMESNPQAHMQRQGWVWSDRDKAKIRAITSP